MSKPAFHTITPSHKRHVRRYVSAVPLSSRRTREAVATFVGGRLTFDRGVLLLAVTEHCPVSFKSWRLSSAIHAIPCWRRTTSATSCVSVCLLRPAATTTRTISTTCAWTPASRSPSAACRPAATLVLVADRLAMGRRAGSVPDLRDGRFLLRQLPRLHKALTLDSGYAIDVVHGHQ